MKKEQGAAECMNDARTCTEKYAQMTQGCSRPVRYEIVRADGVLSPIKFDTAADAVQAAKLWFPDQEQDEDRTGAGWDIQIAGLC